MFKGSFWEPRVCSLRDSGTKWPSLFTPVVVCGGSGKVTRPGGALVLVSAGSGRRTRGPRMHARLSQSAPDVGE